MSDLNAMSSCTWMDTWTHKTPWGVAFITPLIGTLIARSYLYIPPRPQLQINFRSMHKTNA
jgi:hypothetical protein